jgi:hypothetical protein
MPGVPDTRGDNPSNQHTTSNLAVTIVFKNPTYASTPLESVVATTKKTKKAKQAGRVTLRFVKVNHEPMLDGPLKRESWPKLAKLVEAKANPDLKAIQEAKRSYRVWLGPIVKTFDTSYNKEDLYEDPVSYEFEVPSKWSFLMPILDSSQLNAKMDQWALVMGELFQTFELASEQGTTYKHILLQNVPVFKRVIILLSKPKKDSVYTPQNPSDFLSVCSNIQEEVEEVDEPEPVIVCSGRQSRQTTRRERAIIRYGPGSQYVRKNNGKMRQPSSSVYKKVYPIVYKRDHFHSGNNVPSKKDVDLLSLKKMKPHLLTWQHGRRMLSKREPMDGFHSIFEEEMPVTYEVTEEVTDDDDEDHWPCKRCNECLCLKCDTCHCRIKELADNLSGWISPEDYDSEYCDPDFWC